MTKTIAPKDLEAILDVVCLELTLDLRGRQPKKPKDSDEFENWARVYLIRELGKAGLPLPQPRHVQQFPDIVISNLGVEIKYVSEPKWSGVANSIHESHSVKDLDVIYVLFGKGGVKKATKRNPADPEGAIWDRYEDVAYHARTSHRPRFEIDMKIRSHPTRQSIFKRWGIRYDDFKKLTYSEKMGYMKAYAGARRLTTDIDFWWVPLDPKPYVSLPPHEQDEALATACLLCPQIVTGFDQAKLDIAVCMQSMQGILSHETGQIFSASPIKDLQRLEKQIQAAANTTINDTFSVYWGMVPATPADRIPQWLKRVNNAHVAAGLPGPLPSTVLFGGKIKPAP